MNQNSEVTKNAAVSVSLYGRAEIHIPKRTYIIVGNGRGGTSMVAGAVAALGISITPAVRSLNYEDAEIVNAAQGRLADGTKMETTRDENIASVRSIIAARNETSDIWGWKDPSADLYLRDVFDCLRNPHFIFVWRDVAAVATAQLALEPSLDPLTAMQGPLGRLNRYFALINECACPTLMVSYERAKSKPNLLTRDLASFTGVTVNEQMAGVIERFVSPTGGYRELA